MFSQKRNTETSKLLDKYFEIIVSHTIRIAMIISTFGKVSVRD